MKTLKITLIAVVLFTSLFSCTKQDLNEDDILEIEKTTTIFTGGGADDPENNGE